MKGRPFRRPFQFCFPDAAQRAAKRSGAPLIRDLYKLGVWNDPGSAVHHFVLRCARETQEGKFDDAMPTGLKILSGGAMRPLLAEAVPLFERAHGVTADVRFALTSVLAKEIEGGAAFDLALLPRPELDALAAIAAIAPGTQTDIARSTVGLAVRQGAPKPDIATAEALRRALLAARSIGYSDGPSGAYVAGLLQRLGIAAEVAPKTKLTSGPVAELVASGEAELGMQQIVAILPVKGADLVGPLPSELQNVIVYAAGMAAAAQNPDAAAAFIGFMASPQALRIMRAKGLEPG